MSLVLDESCIDGGPVVTVLVGPPGIGRSYVLAALQGEARKRGRPVIGLRLAPTERNVPWLFVSRLAGEVSRLPRASTPSTIDIRELARARDPVTQTAMLVRILREHPGLIVTVDDIQHIDEPSLAAVGAMVRELAGFAVRCVCAVRTPSDVGREQFDTLRAEGLARVAIVRPLSARRTDVLLTRLLQGTPHRTLSEEIARACRGVPAAVRAAVDAHQRSAGVRVVDRKAYVADAGRVPEVGEYHSLLAPIRSLPAPAWSVAKAVAVLHPFGDAVPALISEALGLPPRETERQLRRLVAARVLRCERGGGWAFAVPVVAVALRSCLGLFERRRLAQLAVHTVWAGAARLDDPDFLPDQLTSAGRLVDASRAAAELVRHGTGVAMTDPRGAYWHAAAARVDDVRWRAAALLHHAATACRLGDYAAASASAQQVLSGHRRELSDKDSVEAELLYVTALCGRRDIAALQGIAAGVDALPGRSAPAVLTRAAALAALNQTTAAVRLLAAARPTWSVGESADHGEDLSSRLRALMGQPRSLLRVVDTAIANPRVPSSVLGRDRVAAQVRLLAGLAEVDRALALLHADGLAVTALPWSDQSLLAWRLGEWDDALDHAWRSLAVDAVVMTAPAAGLVYRAAAQILLAQGRPVRARALLDAAGADGASPSQLLAIARAEIESALGAPEEAFAMIGTATGRAGRGAVDYACDELWLLHTELARERGEATAAARGVSEAARAARVMGTDHSGLHHALARVVASGDTGAATEALRAARALGQPFTVARTIERVVRWGGARAELLSEAYELYGFLGALLHRARIRARLRELGITVPHRAEAVAENERLLAGLVAEGLSNRQLAAALHTTEKSVEGRLTRLFARTGYRSRVDLAAATVTREYPEAGGKNPCGQATGAERSAASERLTLPAMVCQSS